MATGAGEGAAGVPEAGSHGLVEFSDYQSLASLPPGGPEGLSVLRT